MDLRTIRRKAGLTQLQLSRRSHVSRVRISLMECKHIRPSWREQVAIDKALLEAAEERAEQIRKLARQRAVALAG